MTLLDDGMNLSDPDVALALVELELDDEGIIVDLSPLAASWNEGSLARAEAIAVALVERFGHDGGFAGVYRRPGVRLMVSDAAIPIEHGEIVLESVGLAGNRAIAALVGLESYLPPPRFDGSRIARAIADVVLREIRP